LEDISVHGAKGLLINITGGQALTLHDANEAVSLIQEESDDDANIIFGTVVDAELGDEVRITVIATGFGDSCGFTSDVTATSSMHHREKFGRKTGDSRNIVQKDNYDLPITVRNKKVLQHHQTRDVGNNYDRNDLSENVNDVKQQQYRVMTPNNSFIFEDDDYDIPAFLRNQAD
jgi:cell division protein FtsZ